MSMISQSTSTKRRPTIVLLILLMNLWLAVFHVVWTFTSGKLQAAGLFVWTDHHEGGDSPVPYLRSAVKGGVINNNVSTLMMTADSRGLSANNTTLTKPSSSSNIAFVTFSHLMNNTERFEDMILGSVNTWLGVDDTYFVVLTLESQQPYQEYCSQHSCNNIHPIFVDCPEGKFREGPCCKQEKGMLYMYENYQHKFEWFVFSDDDVYIRKSYLEQFVKPLPFESSNMILTSGREGRIAKLGKAGFMRRQRAPYWCSHDTDFQYPWGQPVVYSRSALQRVSNGLRLGGLVKQCVEYDVTHDVGNALFHWMYQLPEARIYVLDDEKQLNEEFLKYHAYHGVNKVMRMAPKRVIEQFNMSAIHTRHQEAEQQAGSSSSNTIPYEFHHANGFRKTKTFHEFGDPASWTEWHTMPVVDCEGPYDSSTGQRTALS